MKITILNINQLLIIVLALISLPSIAQDSTNIYERKMIDIGEVNMEYMDFGGDGVPFIWVQDFHTYFGDEYREKQNFFKQFTSDFHVLAPIKRAFGETDKTKSGYDVDTQVKDLVEFLNALGIKKAIFYGRPPATQDLMHLAENYPEYVLALIFDGNPLVFSQSKDPIVSDFLINYSKGSCDISEMADLIVGQRFNWRPRILNDLSIKISLPALRFYDETYDRMSFGMQKLEYIEFIAKGDHCNDQKAKIFFDEIVNNQGKLNQLERSLKESNLMPEFDDAFLKAFNDNLIDIKIDDNFNNEIMYQEIITFLKGIDK